MSYTVELDFDKIYTATLSKSDLKNGTDDYNYQNIYYYSLNITNLKPIPTQIISLSTAGKNPLDIYGISDSGYLSFSLEGSCGNSITIEYTSNNHPDIDFYLKDSNGFSIDLKTYLELMGLPTDKIEIQKLYSKKLGPDAAFNGGVDGTIAYNLHSSSFVGGITSEHECEEDDPFTASSIKYPWMGFIRIKCYKYGGEPRVYLLPGTRPLLANPVLDAGEDIPEVDIASSFLATGKFSAGNEYLVYRSSEKLLVYLVSSRTDLSNGTDSRIIVNSTPVIEYTKENFQEGIIPLRVLIAACGGGGGGQGGGHSNRGIGGHGASTVYGIWDFVTYPGILIKLGTGGDGGDEGGVFANSGTGEHGTYTDLFGISNITRSSSTSTFFTYPTSSFQRLLRAGGGQGGDKVADSAADISNKVNDFINSLVFGKSCNGGIIGGRGGSTGHGDGYNPKYDYDALKNATVSANSSLDTSLTCLYYWFKLDGTYGVERYGFGGGGCAIGLGGAGDSVSYDAEAGFSGGGGGGGGDQALDGGNGAKGGDGNIYLVY